MPYNPSSHTVIAKPLGISQAIPTDGRTYFYDEVNFKYRPYLNTAEVIAYLNSSSKRAGQFPIVINTGGSVNLGVITGGTNAVWYFKDGTLDGNLVRMIDAYTTSQTDNLLLAKADLVDNIVPEDQLPSIYFQDMTGSGTAEDPYSLTSVIGQYLTSLPGYSIDKILYGDLTWRDAPSGSAPVGTLSSPNLSFGTPATTSVTVNWTSVTNATGYQLQRDTSSSFTTPTTLYTGSLLTYNVTGLTASTQYYFRVRATAPSYTSSGYDIDSVTTADASSPSGTPITSFTYLSQLSNVGNEITTNAYDGSGGAGAIAFKIASGQDAWITQKVQAFTESGEGSTGVLLLGIGLDPFYGAGDSLAHISASSNGMVFYKGNNTSSSIVSTNSILRLKIEGSTIYTEYSNNGGSSFTTITTVTRPAGDLRLKMGFGGNQYKIHDLRGFNLTAI